MRWRRRRINHGRLVLFMLVIVGGKFCAMGLFLVSMNVFPTSITNCISICEGPPSLLNPASNRKIRLGGPVYNAYMKEGTWVQHDGTLKQLNLDELRRNQQPDYCPVVPTASRSCRYDNDRRYGNATLPEESYIVKPTVLSHNGQLSATTMDDTQTELLEKELLFVHKSCGLHTVPSRDLSVDSLSSQVSALYPHAKPCHRLDRDTSGIVVFGLTANAHRHLSKQFETRTICKTYTALIAGHPSQDSGVIDLPIGKIKTAEGFNRWTIGGEKPREAVTHWKVLQRFTVAGATFSKVSLEPKTGRGHQLRLHMSAMGHVILGDTLHGDKALAVCAPRLCLHAHKLQVDWKNGTRLECTTVSPF